MVRKIVEGVKDEFGAYLPLPKRSSVKLDVVSPPSPLEVHPSSPAFIPSPDISLDELSKRIIIALDRATKTLLVNISAGDVSRDTLGSLKDTFIMIKDLKKEEKEFLDSLTEEQLIKLSNTL